MAILVYTESEQGKFKKIAFELASYAKAIADKNNTTVTAVCLNAENPMELENYGVDKILNISNQDLKSFNAVSYSQSIFEAAENEKSNIIVISSSADSRYLAPLLAIKHNAAYISNVSELPTNYSPIIVKRTAFTNKAF
ncbi:electron transfer flavoprotein subunit alpha/FixB family protein, partial [Flavobacteriaceae bacterium]|nr:electron transfer flavoprotein subunit alpha/FixB family protein [Flavobacteriaceae bacterium]